MKRVIAYARISNEDQSHFSISGQVEQITEYAFRNNYDLIETFIDEGQSAKNFERKSWRKLEAFLKANYKYIDYLVVLKYDRFSRNIQEALTVIQKLEDEYNIKILSISEPIALPPENPFYFQLRTQMLLQAHVERLVIKERTLFGMNRAKREGRYIGKAPYGYINSRDTTGKPILLINDDEARVVKEMFELYLQNTSFAEIKRIVKKKGFKQKSKDAVFRVLTNITYVGKISSKDENGDVKFIPGIHEAIIDSDIFARVKRLIERPNLPKKINNELAYLKSSIVCPECYKPLSCSKSKGRTKYYWYYECGTHRKSFKIENAHEIFDSILDEISFNDLQIEYLRKNIFELIIAKTTESKGDVKLLNRRKASILAKKDNLEDKFFADKIEEATYYKWRSKYMDELKDIEKTIVKYKTVESSFERYFSASMNYLKSLKLIFNESSVIEKQEFISIGFGRELVYDGNAYRTNYMNPIFKHKSLILKEKGLVFYDTKKGIQNESPLGVNDGSRTHDLRNHNPTL